MDSLEKKLCHSFRDRALLVTALTHSSYANENRSRGGESNERLEFLGDSVLGMVVADALYRRFPELPEGRMTRLRAQLVCEESLHQGCGGAGPGRIRPARQGRGTYGRQAAHVHSGGCCRGGHRGAVPGRRDGNCA